MENYSSLLNLLSGMNTSSEDGAAPLSSSFLGGNNRILIWVFIFIIFCCCGRGSGGFGGFGSRGCGNNIGGCGCGNNTGGCGCGCGGCNNNNCCCCCGKRKRNEEVVCVQIDPCCLNNICGNNGNNFGFGSGFGSGFGGCWWIIIFIIFALNRKSC